eukprot:jgi/Botrbrau1/21480/Bobra.0216s0088.1
MRRGLLHLERLSCVSPLRSQILEHLLDQAAHLRVSNAQLAHSVADPPRVVDHCSGQLEDVGHAPSRYIRGGQLMSSIRQQPLYTSAKQSGRLEEEPWPTSLRQRKFAGRVETALETLLSGGDIELTDTLIREGNMAIVEVRMSPDLLKAYILWDAPPEKVQWVTKALASRMVRLRKAVGRFLGGRHLIRLEFRHNCLSPEQQAVADEFSRLGVQPQSSDWV